MSEDRHDKIEFQIAYDRENSPPLVSSAPNTTYSRRKPWIITPGMKKKESKALQQKAFPPRVPQTEPTFPTSKIPHHSPTKTLSLEKAPCWTSFSLIPFREKKTEGLPEKRRGVQYVESFTMSPYRYRRSFCYDLPNFLYV